VIEAAARLQRPCDPGGDCVGLLDPVQDRVREDRVELAGEGERTGVGHLEGEAGVGATGLDDHFRRRVDPDHGGPGGSDRGGQVPRAGPQVEDAFAGLRREEFDELRPVLPHEGVAVVVEERVPGVGRVHAASRAGEVLGSCRFSAADVRKVYYAGSCGRRE
jgi:hypothetical protein